MRLGRMERVMCMRRDHATRGRWRAILVALLSVTLVVSMLPVQAIAEDSDEPIVLDAADDAVGDDGGDIEISLDDIDDADDEEAPTQTVSEGSTESPADLDESETEVIKENSDEESIEETEAVDSLDAQVDDTARVTETDASVEAVSDDDNLNAQTSQKTLQHVVLDADGLVPQASTVMAVVYNTGELKIGTDLSTSNALDGWYAGENNSLYNMAEYQNGNPWRKYANKVTKVTVTSSISNPNCSNMFRDMNNITSINVSKLRVSNCASFEYMYSGCSKLRTLNMSGWSVSSRSTTATGMYNGCSSLRSVTVGKGFKFCAKLPSYNVNSHTKWYSKNAKKWFTADEIYSKRNGIADTYSKSSSKRSITNSKVKVSIATQAWTGKQIKPTPTVKWESTTLKKGTHFKVVGYGTNKNAGKSNNWVKIQGIGSYTGTRKVSFTIKKPTVKYRTHVQTYGWEKSWKTNGALSGTTGQSKRLEAINIKLTNKPVTGGISYRTHIQTYGWESGWKSNGAMSGTSGQSKRLEAIQIKLTGNMAKKYDVWYCVHAQHFGWLGWAKNGASAGTAKYSYRLEAIKIKLLPKGSSKPAKLGSTTVAFRQKQLRYELMRDTWRFENFEAYIPLSFYTRCYGSSEGYVLYSSADDYGHTGGVCYGMAVTPGAMRTRNYPTVSSFGFSKIYDIGMYDRTSSLGITAKDYIEYAYVEQYDSRLMAERNRNMNNGTSLVSAVRSHIYDGTAIVIDMLGSEGSHSVLPLNITRDDASQMDISVYDSNHPTKAQTIHLYKENGVLKNWDYSDPFSYSNISWDTPADNLKSIMSGNGVSSSSKAMHLVSTTSDVTLESGGKTFRLSPDTTNDLDSVVPIIKTGGTTKGSEKLYWVALDASDLKVSEVSENAKVTICADDSAVEVNVWVDGLSPLSDSEDNVGPVEVTYLEFTDESGEPTRTAVSGKARGNAETFVTPQGKVEVSAV